jgi:hypothetical protein
MHIERTCVYCWCNNVVHFELANVVNEVNSQCLCQDPGTAMTKEFGRLLRSGDLCCAT